MAKQKKNSLDLNSVSASVEDKKHLVYLVFCWLGIGTLLPWNFFISVPGYWMVKWDDPNNYYNTRYYDTPCIVQGWPFKLSNPVNSL